MGYNYWDFLEKNSFESGGEGKFQCLCVCSLIHDSQHSFFVLGT